ncbi:D-glycerate dehydrogenase [Marinomonas sp. C2222]|uniref:D-glycerate dehydrogenase n=1 Tax=Marinomonas sargassi TaxID=2984494 RepID=A0ABT2YNZ9_9GAMM|nr:D-glycerate dehydrogenase [Marinomonas sargassi]MCV2401607.1 D-glycerate dehydrogenase [Marinomonas sargassi]
MKPKVLLYKRIPEQALAKLQAQCDVVSFDGIPHSTEFYRELADAQGLIGSSAVINHPLLKKAPKLKAISTISVGTDQFDHDYLASHQIPLMHTPNVLNETTADTIFTLIMCTARRAVELTNMVKQGNWTSSIKEPHFGTDVHGKTLGIIGMGRIGEALAKRAHFGFDMPIQYCNRSRNMKAEHTYNATYLDMGNLLASSDFVCVMTPLTPDTHKLIGANEFAKMKKSAIFINASRGKVIDETALIEALERGEIRAAGLDVFEVEPLPADSPLCQLNNAVLFPHIGSATAETRLKMIECAIDNLINALKGDLSKNCANAHLFINPTD